MAATTRFADTSTDQEWDLAVPPPGSVAEKQRFGELQRRLPGIFQRLFPDPFAPQTIVVVPSISLDEGELTKLAGVCRYEERLLCLLMLLRRPGIRIVYVSSQKISPAVIDYYLQMLRGVSPAEARQRLTLIDCGDDSTAPLTRKLLARPRLIKRMNECIPDHSAAHVRASTLRRSSVRSPSVSAFHSMAATPICCISALRAAAGPCSGRLAWRCRPDTSRCVTWTTSRARCTR